MQRIKALIRQAHDQNTQYIRLDQLIFEVKHHNRRS